MKKAELGISTLILLTAMILVAAIVFMVFFDVVGAVESETRSVGMSMRENIGSGIHLIKLYAEDGSDSNNVDYMYMEIKLPYASDQIKTNDTLIIVGLDNTSKEYTYDQGVNCTIKDATNSSSIYNTTNANYFGVEYPKGSPTFTDTVVAGEIVRLCFKLPQSIEKDDLAIISVMTKNGYGLRYKAMSRKLMSDKTVYFYP